MTINNRSEEEQQRLSNHMRRKDVLKWILSQALYAVPASEEHVKQFLAVAPPEIFVLLDGLMPRPSQTGPHKEGLHQNRIVQGFVGMAVASREESGRAPRSS